MVNCPFLLSVKLVGIFHDYGQHQVKHDLFFNYHTRYGFPYETFICSLLLNLLPPLPWPCLCPYASSAPIHLHVMCVLFPALSSLLKTHISPLWSGKTLTKTHSLKNAHKNKMLRAIYKRQHAIFETLCLGHLT